MVIICQESSCRQKYIVLWNAVNQILLLKREGECSSERILQKKVVLELERGEEGYNSEKGGEKEIQTASLGRKIPYLEKGIHQALKGFPCSLNKYFLSTHYMPVPFQSCNEKPT